MEEVEAPLILHENVEKHLKCGNHVLKLSLYNKNTNAGFCTFKNTSGFKVINHNYVESAELLWIHKILPLPFKTRNSNLNIENC